MTHPLLGIGLNDWARPDWMSPSVDNFWLLMAMRYGLPGLTLLALAFLLHMMFLVRAKNLSEEAWMLRLGYTVTLCGLIFILATVDIWDAVQIFVFFFLGTGAFLYTSDQSESREAAEATSVDDRRPGTRYSRFPQIAGPGRRRPMPGAGHTNKTRAR